MQNYLKSDLKEAEIHLHCYEIQKGYLPQTIFTHLISRDTRQGDIFSIVVKYLEVV